MNKSKLPLGLRLKHHFTEMDFFYKEKKFGADLNKKKNKWVIIAYFLSSLGIFSRQITHFPIIDIDFDNIRWSILGASLIVGFAILPYIMRWISKKSNGKPTNQHLISAFSFGFFIDFSNEIFTNLFSNLFK